MIEQEKIDIPRENERATLIEKYALENVSDYFSVREAAKVLGVSTRSIYGYIQNGKLTGSQIDHIIVVRRDEVEKFVRPVRVRSSSPRWRLPSAQNSQMLATITIHLRQGQGSALADRLAEIRQEHSHCFADMVACYVACSPCNSDEVKVLLFWRGAAEERQADLATLASSLTEGLDCGMISADEWQVLLHTQ